MELGAEQSIGEVLGVHQGEALADAAYPREMRAREATLLRERREKAQRPAGDRQPATASTGNHGPNDTVGFALSGGGIRSATFCLGVFQALSKLNLLHRIDFLSTVSGGGYFGGFLGALIHRGARGGTAPGVKYATDTLSDPRSKPLGWLRENGRYMAPNGVGDELLAGAIYLRNLVAVHVVVAAQTALILGAAALPRAVLLSDWWGSQLGPAWGGWRRLLVGFATPPLWWSPYLAIPAALVLLLAFPIGWAYWFVQREKKTARTLSDHAAWATSALVLVASLAVAVFGRPNSSVHLVSIFFASTAGMALAWWQLANRLYDVEKSQSAKDGQTDADVSSIDRERFARAKLSRWLTAVLSAAAWSAGFALVDSLGQSLYAWWCATHVGGLTALATGSGFMAALAALKRFALALGEGPGGRRLSLPRAVLTGAAAITVALGLLVVLSALTHRVAWASRTPEGGARAAAVSENLPVVVEASSGRVVALPRPGPASERPDTAAQMDVAGLSALVLVSLVLSVLFGQTLKFVNQSSHQALYSARLTRAFLGASNRRRTGRDGTTDVTEPLDGDDVGWEAYGPHVEGGPLHIVNVTINETVMGESGIEQRDRKGIPMAVGPSGLSAGVKHHALWKRKGSADWVEPLQRSTAGEFRVFGDKGAAGQEVEALSLGSWLAISGAAFTTGLGQQTSMGLSLLLGLANIRLGYWWDSHVRPGDRAGVVRRERLGWTLNWLFPVQTHFFHEFLARFYGPHRRRWYLSDGGHFENTACYELLRRRVPFIVVCDNGRDVDYTFEDLGGLIRKARIDFNADIRLLSRDDIDQFVSREFKDCIGTVSEFAGQRDVAQHRGLSTECRNAHALLGWVYYDEDEKPGSLMLILKPSLSGDEPLDLLQYRQQHKDFPQESTIDQYFDEAQWESYRKLGEHIGMRLFDPRNTSTGWSPAAFCAPPAPACGRQGTAS